MSSRVWGGTTLDARRDARRERLLDVGFELLGAQGSAAVTVRAVCRAAQLTDRYFYESFPDRDALLVAVYDRVGDEAQRVLADALRKTAATPGRAGTGRDGGDPDADGLGSRGRDAVAPDTVARAAVEAFFGLLTEDPRKGRILLLEPMTDATLNAEALRLMPAFGELIRAQLAVAVGSPVPDELEQRLTASALIGALSNLFVRWLDGSLAASEAELTDYCVRLLVHAVPLARRPT
jgi:AcrR family transcriptional regulator